MKTKVIIQATLAIEISETWSNQASITEINNDAYEAAQNKINAINATISKDGAWISTPKHIQTILIQET